MGHLKLWRRVAALPAQTQRWLGLALLALLAVALYAPYLANPLVFDDGNVFYSSRLTEAATTPWTMGIRGLPYFTLGVVETLIGQIQAHRWVSLTLHVATAYQLFRFLEDFLGVDSPPTPSGLATTEGHARLIALLLGLAFVLHPVAVYGAGYLVQRTILMATLFSLLGLRCFLSALKHQDIKQAIWAALWMSLAILCKEHAMPLPFAALALAGVVGRTWAQRAKVAAVFLGLCLPAVALALHTSVYAAFNPYEPLVSDLEGEVYGLPVFSSRFDQWLFSSSHQAQLYFGYWMQWLWPTPSRMSADLRVDFLQPWSRFSALAWLGGLAALGAGAAWWGLRFRGMRGLAFAALFTLLMFAIELVSVRFQEPYVLYRSYLWTAGYAVFAATLLTRLPQSVGALALVAALPLLAWQAVGRLDSFTSKSALWEDAAAKLPSAQIAGSSRIYFNRGLTRYTAGRHDEALSDIDLAIAQSPGNGRYKISRAVSLLGKNRPLEALGELEKAQLLLPKDSHVRYVQFLTLKALGRAPEAEAALLVAAQLGSGGAKFELAKRRSKDGSVKVEMN